MLVVKLFAALIIAITLWLFINTNFDTVTDGTSVRIKLFSPYDTNYNLVVATPTPLPFE